MGVSQECSAIPIILAMNIILPLLAEKLLNGQRRNGSGGQRLLVESGNRRSGRQPRFPLLSIMKPSEKELDDPYRQAEYLYSLIESEG